MALNAHVSKHPAVWHPLPFLRLDDEPPVQTNRPRPSATSPTLIRRRERSMHQQGALLRMWLPPQPDPDAACTSASRSNRWHRRPLRERSLESWGTCARHHELLAQEHGLSLDEVRAHISQIDVATQASALVAFSLEPCFDLPMVLSFSRCVNSMGPGVLNVLGGTAASSVIST